MQKLITRSINIFNFCKIKSVPGNKPPRLADNSSGRYAGALFSSASQNQKLHVVFKDLQNIQSILNDNSQILSFIKNSSIKAAEHSSVIIQPLKQNISKITQKFLTILSQSGRMAQLPKIIEIFKSYYKVLSKQEDVKIISAKQLTQQQKAQVLTSLQKSKDGSSFTVSYEVDEQILGGLQMFRGAEFLDCSLRSRVDRLKEDLSKMI